MESLSDRGRAIQERVESLESLFHTCIELSDITRVQLRDEKERFYLWAVNLGLFDSGHSSLDYRLQDAEDAFQYVAGLLDELLEYVEARKYLATISPA
jgi:hypothetical protein